ncbi:MAG TPA: M56 family metallopeptidase [Flavitalea sp.]|nr:M56 family metallopeptidase [Flavitalea sp.]
MMLLITYLLKVSIALTVVYGFYALLLQNLTFYKWNRIFLIVFSASCFFLPVINLDPWLKENTAAAPHVLQVIPAFNEFIPLQLATNNIPLFTFAFIAAGSFICLLHLIVRYYSLRKIKKNSVLLHKNGNICIYSSATSGSFTLGNDIFIDTTAGHTSEELERVLQHEIIHVRQHHWIDLMTAETICIFNWFNPFAWLIRTAIRRNLEYIADAQVLHKGYNSKSYQYLLLKISGSDSFRITAHFSLTDLKKRISMMNKHKSARVHIVKFIIIFPLIAILLLGFRTVNNTPLIGILTSNDTIPDDNLIGVLSADTTTVYNKDLTKSIIHTGGEELIIIFNKNTKETVAMTMQEWNRNKSANEKKYGKLPKPPVAPVPPVPPAPPVAPEVAAPVVSPAPVVEAAAIPEPPVPPAPPAKRKSK